MWEEYKFTVIASFAVLLFQAALITAPAIQRARRQRAEREAFSLSWRLSRTRTSDAGLPANCTMM
jgi:hypothetical protein